MFGSGLGYKEMMESIAQASSASFAKRLPVGQFQLVVKWVSARRGVKKKGSMIFETEFLVVESNSPEVKPGEARGEAWFPGADEYGYQEQRAHQYVAALAKALQPKEDLSAFGGSLLEWPKQPARGVVVIATVTPQVDKKTGQIKTNPGGDPYVNIRWSTPDQTAEMIAANRAHLDSTNPLPTQAPDALGARSAPAATVAVAVAPPPPVAPQPTAAAPVPNLIAGLTLGKKPF